MIAVRAGRREDGTLLAELDLMTPLGRERLDCRPSDGIVLALRMPSRPSSWSTNALLEDAGDVAPADPVATTGSLEERAPAGGAGPGSDQIGT